MIAETPQTADVRGDLERSVRALHDDAWRRHEDTKAELARIAQAASLLGVQLDMVRPFRAARVSWADIDVEPTVSAEALRAMAAADQYLQGGIIPRDSIRMIADDPEVVIPLERHRIPTQAETVEGGEPEGIPGEDRGGCDEPEPPLHPGTGPTPEQSAGSPPEVGATTAEPGVVAPPARSDDRARAVAEVAGEILDPAPEPEYRCRWCSFTSNRSQAVGSHESSQHRDERAAEKARREDAAARPARVAAQMAEDLANYRGPVLACHDSQCFWCVPVAKTGAFDHLATHTLSEHGRAPSRRERTPQERP